MSCHLRKAQACLCETLNRRRRPCRALPNSSSSLPSPPPPPEPPPRTRSAAPYTGNPDVDFRTHMIPHHQGAIAMAKVGLKYATDAETKKMAQKIIDDQ